MAAGVHGARKATDTAGRKGSPLASREAEISPDGSTTKGRTPRAAQDRFASPGPGIGITPDASPTPPPAPPAPRSRAPRTPPAPPAPGRAPDESPAPSGGSRCTPAGSGPIRATRAGRRLGSPGHRGGTRPASTRSTSPGTGPARTSAHGSPCPGIIIASSPGASGGED